MKCNDDGGVSQRPMMMIGGRGGSFELTVLIVLISSNVHSGVALRSPPT